jgi:hypothetical protein
MNMHLHASSTVQRSRDIPFSQLDDDLLAIDPNAGCCYALNETAGRVWELIATPTPVQAVCDQLRQEFDVDESACLEEVLALLQELSLAGLVIAR